MAEHREEVRECLIDGHRWPAARWLKQDATAPFVGRGLTRQQQAAYRQTIHEERLAAHHRWARCPQCGSTKVKTIGSGTAAARRLLAPPQAATPLPSRRPATPAPVGGASPHPAGLIEEVERLAALRREGLLTDEEFTSIW